MEQKRVNPAMLVGLAMLILVTGGFLTLLQVGMSARQNKGISYGFSFRGAAQAASDYFGDVERGAKIVKSKSASLFDDYFGSGSIAYPPEQNYASARGAGRRGDEAYGEYAPEGDAFEKYYQENYGSGSSDYAPSSSYGGGVGSFAGGGGSGSFQAADPGAGAVIAGAPGGETPAAGEDAPQSVSAAPGARAAGAGPAGGGPAAAPKLYASLPLKGADRADSALPGAGGAPAEFGGGSKTSAPRGGGLDAFKGGGAAKNLDSATEGARSGAQGSYNAKMGGGAAAVASGGGGGGGGAVPAASGPEKAAAGAAGAAGSAASGGSTGPSFDRSSRSGDDTPSSDAGGFQEEDQDLLKSVVVEKLNGAEGKIISESDAAGELDAGVLKSGGVAGQSAEKGAEEEVKDPEVFTSLTDTRKQELKKQVHVLLKKVEKRFGPMKDIEYVTCRSYPEVCEKHGLTQNFMTMTTANDATLALGVKYVRKKWRPYTINFKNPAASLNTAVPGADDEEEVEEE